MIEKVARALALSAGAAMTGPGRHRASDEIGWKGDGAHLEQYVDRHWREHVHAAGFAIEAMREPPADTNYRFEKISPAYKGVWAAMIEAALTDGQSPQPEKSK